MDLTNELQDDQIWAVMLHFPYDCTMQILLLYSSVYNIQKIFTSIELSRYNLQNMNQLSAKSRQNAGFVYFQSASDGHTKMRSKKGVFRYVLPSYGKFCIPHVSTFPMRPSGRVFPFVQAFK